MYDSVKKWFDQKHQAVAQKAIDIWVQQKGQGTTEYAILVGVLTISDSVLGERVKSWNR